MKNIFFALLSVLLTTSIAFAAWQDSFSEDFAKDGTATVKNALAQASPGEIIDVTKAAGIETKALVTAMCDAGLSPQDLEEFQAELAMTINDIITACGLGNISYENQFPGATKESTSVSKETNYAGNGEPLGSGAGTTPIPIHPASPDNYRR